MKTFRKIVLVFGTLVASLALLSGCAQSSPNTAVVTMKGHQITVTDLYNEAKTFPNQPTTTLLQNLTFSYIFEKEFGKQVTTQNVQNAFNQQQTTYGGSSSFSSALAQQGYTTTSYMQTLRLNLLQQKAVDKQISETQYSEANLKKAWETYHPEVDTYITSTTNQADAQKAQNLATTNADQFKSQAKDNKLEVKFDSSNTSIPSAVQTAAFKLKNDQVSDVITATDSSGTTIYYVVYMISNPNKGTDMNKYTSQLKNYIKTQKENDSSFVTSVIKTYLKNYDVTVKENAFGNIFSNFTGVAQ